MQADTPTAPVWLEPRSREDDGADVSWLFAVDTPDRRTRWVRAGVRIAAREQVLSAAEPYLHGDWTPALLAYAAAAARLTPGDGGEAWVTPANVGAIRGIVEAHRLGDVPLFHGGTVEDNLQLGMPEGDRRGAAAAPPESLPH